MNDNAHKIFVTTGASNHAITERASDDLYITDPRALEMLLQEFTFNSHIWEPACGLGHLSEVLIKNRYQVFSTDIKNYGYDKQEAELDFLSDEIPELKYGQFSCDIITNPPYSKALEFARRALSIIKKGCHVALFLRLQFLEGKARREFFNEHPPRYIYVFSSRMNCLKPNGENQKSSAICYAWFIWTKGFKGNPEVFWL